MAPSKKQRLRKQQQQPATHEYLSLILICLPFLISTISTLLSYSGIINKPKPSIFSRIHSLITPQRPSYFSKHSTLTYLLHMTYIEDILTTLRLLVLAYLILDTLHIIPHKYQLQRSRKMQLIRSVIIITQVFTNLDQLTISSLSKFTKDGLAIKDVVQSLISVFPGSYATTASSGYALYESYINNDYNSLIKLMENNVTSSTKLSKRQKFLKLFKKN